MINDVCQLPLKAMPSWSSLNISGFYNNDFFYFIIYIYIYIFYYYFFFDLILFSVVCVCVRAKLMIIIRTIVKTLNIFELLYSSRILSHLLFLLVVVVPTNQPTTKTASVISN